jgi:hypothetical protein
MPIDPESGGTWIAVNDAGVVFALLNANPESPASKIPAPRRSRGTIISALADSASAVGALAKALTLPFADVRPFRLLLVDEHHFIECWPHRGRLRRRRTDLLRATMRTSSGLGDALVQRPRRGLFRAFFDDPSDPVVAQDAFHAHHWPGRGAVSVHMCRANARTVSRTTVEVREREVRLAYRATGQDTGQEAVEVVLARAAPPARTAQGTRVGTTSTG